MLKEVLGQTVNIEFLTNSEGYLGALSNRFGKFLEQQRVERTLIKLKKKKKQVMKTGISGRNA